MTTVPRTCTELREAVEASRTDATPSQPLWEFRDRPAIVLLGDPGMGKTTAFKEEQGMLEDEESLLLPARDFITFDPDNHPEWRGKTLFIDGLDEVRSGSADARVPFDSIRRNLDKLGRPWFRLSCRHADWLATDRQNLEAVSQTREVVVLRLDPLNDDGVDQMLVDAHVDDTARFVNEAGKHGMAGILRNPQSLTMLVRAVRHGTWPETRKETFAMACRSLATEHNEEHLGVLSAHDPDQILDTAGRLCAALLISGIAGFSRHHTKATDSYPYISECGFPETECRQAIATKLFSYAGHGRDEPVHRHIAEYVAARYLATLIEQGLSPGRVLALLTGPDAMVVSQLRGLSAWLAACSPLARRALVEKDPVGVGLYGDVSTFDHDSRLALLRSLGEQPRELIPTYRTAPAFAALATPAMQDAFREILTESTRDDDRQLIVDFVLKVLCCRPLFPSLSDVMLDVVRDGGRKPWIAESALRGIHSLHRWHRQELGTQWDTQGHRGRPHRRSGRRSPWTSSGRALSRCNRPIEDLGLSQRERRTHRRLLHAFLDIRPRRKVKRSRRFRPPPRVPPEAPRTRSTLRQRGGTGRCPPAMAWS